jgi:hypothetical protein
MPRHQTMQAVADWSYGLLGQDEQRFLRVLGIFAGGFTGEAAAAVAVETARSNADAIDRLADLVTKSLVVVDVGGTRPRFRLLDTTRAYMLDKLDTSGERDSIARRHARHYRDLFEGTEGGTVALPPSGWLADAAREIDNVRAALDWSFSPLGNATIGAELTAAYVPVWLNLSLGAECRERCEHALRRLATAPIPDARLRMRLQIGLGSDLAAGEFVEITDLPEHRPDEGHLEEHPIGWSPKLAPRRPAAACRSSWRDTSGSRRTRTDRAAFRSARPDR